ncbi:hypothetical protein Vi05172_g5930 [Venturia inaequalis]|nr:hypothetical protein Vi05172_g5930 [Venturia inaequalis]
MIALIGSTFVIADNHIDTAFSLVIVIREILAKGVERIVQAVSENLLGWGFEGFAVRE